MPFSGTGAFTLVAGNPVVSGTNISSTVQNNTMSDVANGLTNCVTRDGQSPPTANLPMGNQRFTGAGSASGVGEFLVYGQALNGSDLTLTGDLTVGDDLTVTGDSSLAAVQASSLIVTGGTALNGSVGLGDAAADTITFTGTPGGQVESSTYTPTLTGVSNITTSTAFVSRWTRVGNVVSVGGQMSVTATAANSFTFIDISLPVASNFSAVNQLSGTGTSIQTGAEYFASITANFTNDRAAVLFRSQSGGFAGVLTFCFSYQVI